MIRRLIVLCLIGYFSASLLAADVPQGPKVEVCFVLDTTGSMGGLIEGAKQKIWSIANDMIALKPKPQSIKFALVGYRDRGDDYITKPFDLTDDIDTVFKNLKDFSANGGGDGPESVNQALDEAVEKIAWSKEKDTLRIIFLVGDAPPHMDYANDVKYPDICKKAVTKGLIINAVQCGNEGDTTPIWQEIARLSEGTFIQLGQTGDMVAITTPMDKELAELNHEIGKTMVGYGGAGGRAFRSDAAAAMSAKQAAAEEAPASVTADRLKYNLASDKTVQGEDELIDAINGNQVKLEDLKDEQLPEDLRKLTPEQRKARVEELTKQRADIRAKIEKLSKARDEYIVAEKKKLAEAGKKDSFDDEVSKTIEEQVKRKK